MKKRDLDRRIEELEKKLAALAPARAEQTEVKVFVVAGAPLDADMTVRYQVRNAGWTPHYDARLATGSKTAPPLLELTRRADIVQRTGESWDNVAAAAVDDAPQRQRRGTRHRHRHRRLRAGGQADVGTSMPAPPPAPMAAYDGLAVRKKVAAGRSGAARRGAAEPERRNGSHIGEQGASVAAAPFQAVFGVPGRLTVPATGEAKRVFLQQDGVEPVLTVRTVPKLEAKAYLYAKLILPKGSPVLPGAVSLFRDGTFVGTGALPVLSPGEDHELGFGADDQVRVRHAIADEKRGETGLISSARTDSRNYRITVKNMHERAVELVVHDQIPGLAERRHQGRVRRAGAADQKGHRRQARGRRLRVQAGAGGGAPHRVRLPGHLAGGAGHHLPLSPVFRTSEPPADLSGGVGSARICAIRPRMAPAARSGA